jgi:hypothetical protein
MTDSPVLTSYPHDRLSRLAAAMTAAIDVIPGTGDIRAVVMLNDRETGCVHPHGYPDPDDERNAMLFVDTAIHLREMGRALGVRVDVLINGKKALTDSDVKDLAMPPFIPPPAAVLAADTEKAIAAWTAGLASPDEWLSPRLPEVAGIAAIIAAQFPDVPADTLGRILASASMATGAVCAAMEQTGEFLAPWDLAIMLGFAGAKLTATGGEIAEMQG